MHIAKITPYHFGDTLIICPALKLNHDAFDSLVTDANLFEHLRH